jgi:dolichol-phosphate mannosyltransferase
LKAKRFTHVLTVIGFVQAILGMRVILRLLRTAGGRPILSEEAQAAGEERISVIVPVLNERDRLAPCLEGLIAQGTEVSEIVVVDGGSDDNTRQLVYACAARDSRVRLVDASPVPANWNGKAWGLQLGLRSSDTGSRWILTVDADVRPVEPLARALLGRAKRCGLAALSIATLQEIEGIGEGLLHPALLTTLVYRSGIPGNAFRRVSEVQANGQCFLFSRDVLEACGGFVQARTSICEDITLARTLVARGYAVGFYEAGDLVSVKMYTGWRETWRNWTRSLPMRDQFSGTHTLLGWLEVALVQALPLPLVLLLVMVRARRGWLFTLNGILAMMRLGVLSGTARAYRQRPWSYWLSPLCDIPVALQLGRSALQRRHIWRGRVLVREKISIPFGQEAAASVASQPTRRNGGFK